MARQRSYNHVVGGKEVLEDNRIVNKKIRLKDPNESYKDEKNGRHNGQRVDVADSNVQRGNKMTYAQILMRK